MVGIERENINDLSRKVEAVLQAAGKLKVDLLVFPEYSIPPQCLPQIAAASKHFGMFVVAGSHLVRSSIELATFYKTSGLEALASHPADFVRNALSPVFRGNE